jgi:hypothetical protein
MPLCAACYTGSRCVCVRGHGEGDEPLLSGWPYVCLGCQRLVCHRANSGTRPALRPNEPAALVLLLFFIHYPRHALWRASQPEPVVLLPAMCSLLLYMPVLSRVPSCCSCCSGAAPALGLGPRGPWGLGSSFENKPAPGSRYGSAAGERLVALRFYEKSPANHRFPFFLADSRAPFFLPLHL